MLINILINKLKNIDTFENTISEIVIYSRKNIRFRAALYVDHIGLHIYYIA